MDCIIILAAVGHFHYGHSTALIVHKIFLDLLTQKVPFFSLKLSYEGDTLVEAILNGQPISTEVP